jgi:hypothetical protein
MHSGRNDKAWDTLGTEAKLDTLHEDIGKLFAIAEALSHKDHVFIDAINLVHGRLDSQAKAIRRAQKHIGHQELAD